MKRGIYVAGCICLAMVVMASPAGAKKKKKPASLGPVTAVSATGNASGGVGGVTTATATCPAGTQAAGGGHSTPFTATGRLTTYESYRSAPNAWTVSAVNLQGAGGGFTTAFAYCRKSSKPITTVSATAPVLSGGGQTASATAACPAGAKLISGGFRSTRGPSTTAVTLPHDNLSDAPGQWKVRVINNTNGAQTITAHAYCVAKLRAPQLLSATALASNAPEYSAITPTTPACPAPAKKSNSASAAKKKKKKRKPRRLSAGGFSTPPLGPGVGVAIFTDSRLVGAGWQAKAVNADAGGSLAATSQGICA